MHSLFWSMDCEFHKWDRYVRGGEQSEFKAIPSACKRSSSFVLRWSFAEKSSETERGHIIAKEVYKEWESKFVDMDEIWVDKCE